MDKEKFEKAIQGLRWEARYVKRAQGEDPKDYFMAEIEVLDENLAAILRSDAIHGKTLLDVGTGVGWQAIRMAELGYEVTATDVSSFSLEQAIRNAKREGVAVEFLKDNVLATSITRRFDIVVDRGCFAGQLSPYFRDYVEGILKLLKPDGHYLLTIPRGGEEPKLELLAEKFDTILKNKSTYLGPRGEVWKTWFMHLRPMGAVTRGAPNPEG